MNTFHATKNLSRIAIVTSLTLALNCPAPALAASSSDTLAVSATVAATCTVAGNTLAFGIYSGQLIDASTTIAVTCTNTTTYSVALSSGAHAGSGGGEGRANRRMAGPGAARLAYALFNNSGRTTEWTSDAGEGGQGLVSGTGNGAAQLLTIYGRLTAAQYVTPGSYSDTVTATVTY